MRIETRRRMHEDHMHYHYDLVLLPESVEESKIINLLGQPDTKLTGEIRLADGYGEHYILLQPVQESAKVARVHMKRAAK